jgi:hypothetical protein
MLRVLFCDECSLAPGVTKFRAAMKLKTSRVQTVKIGKNEFETSPWPTIADRFMTDLGRKRTGRFGAADQESGRRRCAARMNARGNSQSRALAIHPPDRIALTPSPRQGAQGRYRSPKSAVGNGVAGDRARIQIAHSSSRVGTSRVTLSFADGHCFVTSRLTITKLLFFVRNFREQRVIPPLPPPKNPS